jgi:hypothetical protein
MPAAFRRSRRPGAERMQQAAFRMNPMSFRATHMLFAGIAAAALAAGMSIGDAHANGWPQPNTPCNEANAGQTYDVQYYSRWERLQITYYCDGASWQVFQVCDLNPGGICVVY